MFLFLLTQWAGIWNFAATTGLPGHGQVNLKTLLPGPLGASEESRSIRRFHVGCAMMLSSSKLAVNHGKCLLGGFSQYFLSKFQGYNMLQLYPSGTEMGPPSEVGPCRPFV